LAYPGTDGKPARAVAPADKAGFVMADIHSTAGIMQRAGIAPSFRGGRR